MACLLLLGRQAAAAVPQAATAAARLAAAVVVLLVVRRMGSCLLAEAAVHLAGEPRTGSALAAVHLRTTY